MQPEMGDYIELEGDFFTWSIGGVRVGFASASIN